MMPGFSVESPGEWLMAVLTLIWPLAGPVVMAARGAASRSGRVGRRRTAMTVSALIVLFVATVQLIASYPEPITTIGATERSPCAMKPPSTSRDQTMPESWRPRRSKR
jgi:hypothetical protein